MRLSPERGEAREDAPIRSQITRAVPIEVERVRQRMERWRQERAAGAPIPSALWAAAANAPLRHGVSRTTRALKLDYNKLKLRFQEGAPVEPARFMELAPPAPAAQCRIEIEGPSGTRIKIALPAADGAQLAMALCGTVGGLARRTRSPQRCAFWWRWSRWTSAFGSMG